MDRQEIKTLLRQWAKQQVKYTSAMRDQDRLAANRYEGIATGYRWCIADLIQAAGFDQKRTAGHGKL